MYAYVHTPKTIVTFEERLILHTTYKDMMRTSILAVHADDKATSMNQFRTAKRKGFAKIEKVAKEFDETVCFSP